MKTRSLTLLAAFVLCVPLAAQKKRAFTIEDLYRVKSVSGLAVSADGRSAAFSVATPDLARAKRTSVVWMMNADGTGLRQVTRGSNDSSPSFSPDGRALAFVRSDNVHLLPVAGGEARQLTTFSTGVADPIWSPDGRWIAFTSDVYPECGADDACNKRNADRVEQGKLKAH
ncbi:MAG TPA: DPP IV N-terminal domain-containing protein, partial [Thermoanaerobaculia bacterium]|nr:DPP IV N-terminal domain-containing protein [Thermoanaerobaculia bacterium]